MRVPSRRPVFLVALLTLLVLAPTAPARAQAADPAPYLALGDSVAYGWDAVTAPGAAATPSFHVGYPEVLAEDAGLAVTNASCPGETSGPLIDLAAPDNGCTTVRDLAGLKTDWGTGSQLDVAVAFLEANPDTALVTLTVGANDLFLCQRDTVDGCTRAEFAAVVARLGRNLAETISTLRDTGYPGPIVLVSYYALDYRDPIQVALSATSRAVFGAVALAFDDVRVADGLGAFWRASWRSGGDPCGAGLLLKLPSGGCDIHTSPAGDQVLADAVAQVVDLG